MAIRTLQLQPASDKGPESPARMSRREAIRRGLLGAGALAAGEGLWRPAFGAAQPPLPEAFPASLRRSAPVEDLNQAVVFTVNSRTTGKYGVDLCRCTGSDVLIRGWFKWGRASAWQRWEDIPRQAHRLGALFGGGITCSALYEDGQSGLPRAQVLDMATRNASGQLVDAWGRHGIRHGSLSNPAYLDYLLGQCCQQIDAGVDYLFMDENTAALQPDEGYDDYSLRDFRRYLLAHFPATRDWTPHDARWRASFKIDLADRETCPGGDMRSFSYRDYLRKHGLQGKPVARANPLAAAWREFRTWRDDRAWKFLTDRLRAYARMKDRRIFISANGLVRYVDLQVLGVWKLWLLKNGQVDLSRSQLPEWRKLVLQGHALAGKRVPVVLFHDWGMGDPPFRWLAVSPAERKLWMRTRGAEIYAAGGFFAFPVLGPFGCDAARDGTLETIIQQTRFYQAHRQLYCEGRFLGCKSVSATAPNLSLAAWATGRPDELAVHVINRVAENGQIRPRRDVALGLPLGSLPKAAYAVSPDWPGERPVSCAPADGGLRITLNELQAYAVVRLRYEGSVDVSLLSDPAAGA